MSNFATSGSLSIEIDQSSLRDARDEIESEIGSVTVGVDRAGGGGRRVRADGGQRGPLRRLRTLTQQSITLDEDRNSILSDIHDELDDGLGGSGGGGGLGVGGGGGGGGGLAAGAGGGLLARAGIGGLGATALTAGGAGLAGLAAGLGGTRLLDELGALDFASDLGGGVRGLPGGDVAGDLLQAGGLQRGAVFRDIANLDFRGARNTWNQGGNQQEDAILNMGDRAEAGIDTVRDAGETARDATIEGAETVAGGIPSPPSPVGGGILADAVLGGGGGGGPGRGGRSLPGPGQLPSAAQAFLGAARDPAGPAREAVAQRGGAGLPSAAQAMLGATDTGGGAGGGGGTQVTVPQRFEVSAGGGVVRDTEQRVREIAERKGEETRREVQREIDRGTRGGPGSDLR